jgi:hypothetical protein
MQTGASSSAHKVRAPSWFNLSVTSTSVSGAEVISLNLNAFMGAKKRHLRLVFDSFGDYFLAQTDDRSCYRRVIGVLGNGFDEGPDLQLVIWKLWQIGGGQRKAAKSSHGLFEDRQPVP